MPSTNLLTKVDGLLRGDHCHLDEADDCYFLREYTARAGYSHSPTNSLISNLKKPMDRRGRHEWRYKEQAIVEASDGLAAAIWSSWQLDDPLIVPAPPSTVRSNPLHDDRILQVARRIGSALSFPFAELLENRADREPQHATDRRRSIRALAENLQYVHVSLAAQPTRILLIDDVLTTGATFRACKSVLREHLPGVAVSGVFVARRVADPDDDAPEDDDW